MPAFSLALIRLNFRSYDTCMYICTYGDMSAPFGFNALPFLIHENLLAQHKEQAAPMADRPRTAALIGNLFSDS